MNTSQSSKVTVAVRTRIKLDTLGERYEAECVKKLDDTSILIQQSETGEKLRNCTCKGHTTKLHN